MSVEIRKLKTEDFAGYTHLLEQVDAPEVHLKVYSFNQDAKVFYENLGFTEFETSMRKMNNIS